MALQTKTISVSCDHGYGLELRLTENSVSAADNTSELAWALVLTSGAYHFIDYRIGWSVTLNGTAVSTQAWASAAYRSMSKNSQLTLAAGSVTVPHGSDGSKTLTASASMTMARSDISPVSGSSGTGTVNLSGTMALTDIPRASGLTAANGTLGTAQTLTIHRTGTAYTHTLTYACGSLTGQTAGLGTIAGSGADLTCSFTPPLALAAQNTTGQAVALTFTLTTRDGGNTVGTASAAVTMAIPASVKPAASAAVEAVSDNATVRSWGVAVKGYSKYKVTASFTGAQGSTLAARTVKIAATGETLTASPATSRLLAATDRTVTVQVRDSRGRWSDPAAVTGPVIYDCGKPWINSCAAFRCDGQGTADESGSYLSVRCSGGVYSCGGHNAAAIRVRCRPSGGTWSGWTNLTDGAAAVLNAGLSAAQSCDVEFRVADSLGAARTLTVTVPTAAVALNLRPGGSGAAFGKYAERDGAVDFGPWDPIGRVLGLGQAGAQLQNADLNDILVPGVYGVWEDSDVPGLSNCPSACAGTLRVWNAMGDRKTGGAWHYLIQEYVDYNADVWLRRVRSNGSGVYQCESWKKITMT